MNIQGMGAFKGLQPVRGSNPANTGILDNIEAAAKNIWENKTSEITLPGGISVSFVYSE